MAERLLPLTVPLGAYPERAERKARWSDRAWDGLARTGARHGRANRISLRRFVERVAAHGREFEGRNRGALADEAERLRRSFLSDGLTDEIVARCFALVREAGSQVLGQRHFDVQMIGGRVLLHGMVAEMETGEGKTLTATLPACAVALAGVPVHIVTVNDYLARRDAEWMGPIYETLGLSVGTIVHGMDHDARRAAYACDVTYCTNKEIAFDYLRDRITLADSPSRIHLQLERLCSSRPRDSRLLLRGLHYAIVDEADSVLVDEARTPLIISSAVGGDDERRVYEKALELADELQPGRHFTLDRGDQKVDFTGAGRGRLHELSRPLPGVWRRRRQREELVHQALTARHLFKRDRHYLIRDGKVQIIDEYTGRTMPDRSWEHGLHQAIEAKEGCPITKQNRPVARISYQRFFRRYRRLAGMTGTAREVAGELGAVYDLAVVRAPTNKPLRRTALPTRVFARADDKWRAIVDRIATLHREGRPILVGTRSVDASEHLGRLLDEAGLPYRILNARQDREEADIVARAGERSMITVATNMAGRGTDIRLGDGVAGLGGLHVLATELHDARRIDRQLFGRCGRQGDPGSHEAMVSLEDELVEQHGGWLVRRLAARLKRRPGAVDRRLGLLLVRIAQRAAERRHSTARKDLLRMDIYLEKALAFTGSGE